MIEDLISSTNQQIEESSESELQRIANTHALTSSKLLENENKQSVKKIVIGSSIVMIGFSLIPSTEEGIGDFLRTITIYSGSIMGIIGGYKLFKSYRIKKRWFSEREDRKENKKENEKEERLKKEKKQFYVHFSNVTGIKIPKYTSSESIVEKTYAEKVFPIEPHHPINYCDPFRNLFLGAARVKEKKTFEYALQKTVTCGDFYSETYDEERKKVFLTLEKKEKCISFMYDTPANLMSPQIERVQIKDRLSLLFQNKGMVNNCFNIDILYSHISE